MILEAQPAHFLSTEYVLKLNDRSVGRFQRRWLSSVINVELADGRQLQFTKMNLFGNRFRFVDAGTGEILASGQRAGLFTRTWNLELQTGPAELVPKGVFSSVYEVRRNGRAGASASRILFKRGWRVDSFGALNTLDGVFVGLLYRVVLRRRQESGSGN